MSNERPIQAPVRQLARWPGSAHHPNPITVDNANFDGDPMKTIYRAPLSQTPHHSNGRTHPNLIGPEKNDFPAQIIGQIGKETVKFLVPAVGALRDAASVQNARYSRMRTGAS